MCRIVHAFDFVTTLQYVSFQYDSLHINQPSSLSLNVTTICYQPSAMRSSNWAFPGPTLEEFLANTSSSRGTYCLTFLLMFIPKISKKSTGWWSFINSGHQKKRRLLKMKNKNCWKYQQCIFFSNNFHASTLMFCFVYTKELDNFRNSFHPKQVPSFHEIFFLT